MMARVYGSHLPMKLQMEEKILGQFQRFPGLRSSFAGLEALSGRDMEIEFGDYLNGECLVANAFRNSHILFVFNTHLLSLLSPDPRYSEEQVDGLVKMERKFGDLPGDRMS